MGSSIDGKKICTVISAYMVIKSIVNLILGFSFVNIGMLVIHCALAYTLIKAIPQLNKVTAIFLVLICAVNVKDNITGHHLFYLLEGVIDCVSAYLLLANKSVKDYFSQK